MRIIIAMTELKKYDENFASLAHNRFHRYLIKEIASVKRRAPDIARDGFMRC